MGNTSNKQAIQLTESMFGLWDKAQVIGTFTQTNLGINIVFVGNKEETTKYILLH